MSLIPEVSAQDHHRGPLDARLVVVHLWRFRVPIFGRFSAVTRATRCRNGKRGLRCFSLLSLADLHPHALNAALAAQAAGDKFWKCTICCSPIKTRLEDDDLLDYAAQIGLNRDEFARAMNAGETRARVEQSIESGHRSGAHGTPTVFVNGKFYDNDQQLWKSSKLGAILEAAL